MVCRILVADDSSTIQKVIRIGLAALSADLKPVASLMEATRLAEPGKFDLIIADAGLPGVSVAGDFTKLLERAGRVPMIILMGSYDAVRESELRAAGISHIIKKPFPPGELPQLVNELLGVGKGFQSGGGVSDSTVLAKAVPSPLAGAFSLAEEAGLPPMRMPPEPYSSQSGAPSFGGGGAGLPGMPVLPEVEPARKGRPAFEVDHMEETKPRPAGYGPMDVPQEPLSFQRQQGQAVAQQSGAILSAELEAFVRNELPALVDRAVERYCAEHFKGVAKEALTAELRRLADEKARYLVDQ